MIKIRWKWFKLKFTSSIEKKRKNEQRSFSEGWVEFKRKKHAKQAALKLNNTMCGGKRKNPWYSELWNIKYLKKFRWTHLNERMAYEQELRKQRLRQEIQLAKKETNFYIQNVEKSMLLDFIKFSFKLKKIYFLTFLLFVPILIIINVS